MSARFTRANSTRLRNLSIAVQSPPFSFGLWFRVPTSGNSELIWSMAPGGGDSDGYILFKSGSNTIGFGLFDSGGYSEVVTGAAIASNAWTFTTVRVISTTNRWISVRHASGAHDPAQDTASRSPAGTDAVALGGWAGLTPDVDFFSGDIAEYWMAAGDIQPGGAQLSDVSLGHLAFRGPFSAPHIARNIAEYRALRSGLENHRPGEVFWGAGKTRPVWSNVNGVTLAPHVRLSGAYRGPMDFAGQLVV